MKRLSQGSGMQAVLAGAILTLCAIAIALLSLLFSNS
jgi:hypothetical protein